MLRHARKMDINNVTNEIIKRNTNDRKTKKKKQVDEDGEEMEDNLLDSQVSRERSLSVQNAKKSINAAEEKAKNYSINVENEDGFDQEGDKVDNPSFKK